MLALNQKSLYNFYTALNLNHISLKACFLKIFLLIESLGQSVIKGCQKIDLRSYPEQLRKFDLPISKILNEAWTEVLANSPNYKDWEEQKITAIGTII